MKTNILTLIITLVVGVIMTGALLAPVVSDAQINSGETITMSNEGGHYRLASDGDSFSNMRVDSVDNWKNNDENLDISNTLGLISDVAYIQVFNSGNNSAGVYYLFSDPSVPHYFRTLNVEFGSDSMAITTEEPTVNIPYSWACVPCVNDATYALVGADVYMKTITDLIIGGVDSTNNVAWYYKNGETYATGDGEVKITSTTTLAEGTTDIYTANLSIVVEDNAVTPIGILAPLTVTGHSDSGGMYYLYAAIPVIVIVGLVLVAINGLRIRSD